MFRGWLFFAYIFVASATPFSDPPQVDLGYAKYEGTKQINGQNQFLGIRYAAAPLAELRFRKPQSPKKVTSLQSAKEFGPICPGVSAMISNKTSEDCLYLNIWAPSNATPKSKLPVFFWIPGGGYIELSDVNYNGSELVAATGNQMIFVNINYRVGPFGFLAGEKVRQQGDLNVGLLDQRQALQWVQEHIHAVSPSLVWQAFALNTTPAKFGGNPDNVVLVGDSAGAGSIAMQLIAYNGAPTNLFAGAFGISPFFPAQPDVSELEWQFDAFVSKVGCSGSADTMMCLRDASSSALQAGNIPQTFPGRTNPALFGFTPTIDGNLIADFPYKMFEEGRFVKVPVVFGDDTDEGTVFSPNATSPAEVAEFFKDNYPKLTTPDTNAINSQYPEQVSIPQHAAYFPSAAAAYGDTTFVCPGLQISAALANYTKSWNYRYNVLTPDGIASGFGVYHTAEVAYLFGPGNAPGALPPGFSLDPDALSLAPILRQYYTSFVRDLDPNAHTINGSVFWPEFRGGKRLLLQVNATTVETVPPIQTQRCGFWKTLSNVMEQ